MEELTRKSKEPNIKSNGKGDVQMVDVNALTKDALDYFNPFGTDVDDWVDIERRKMLKELRKQHSFDGDVSRKDVSGPIKRERSQCKDKVASMNILDEEKMGKNKGELKRGFKACGINILGLDGCFIKGPYPE
ncbi:hypothetical protein Tco_0344934 [Tanacetum coccineum]